MGKLVRLLRLIPALVGGFILNVMTQVTPDQAVTNFCAWGKPLWHSLPDHCLPTATPTIAIVVLIGWGVIWYFWPGKNKDKELFEGTVLRITPILHQFAANIARKPLPSIIGDPAADRAVMVAQLHAHFQEILAQYRERFGADVSLILRLGVKLKLIKDADRFRMENPVNNFSIGEISNFVSNLAAHISARK